MSTAIETNSLPAARRRSASRTISRLVALLLALLGLGIGGAGGVLLAVFDGDGTVRSGSQSLSTPASAFASSVTDISDLDDISGLIGQPRVGVTAEGQDLFIGVGHAKDVDRYLAAAAIEEITDVELEPFRLDRELHPGSTTPAPPGAQPFWVASSSDGVLRWDVHDGDYRIVVMNRDGSRGVTADVNVGLTVPRMPAIAWTFAGLGGSLLLAALAIAAASVRRRHSSND
jgi:hypothetical protein